MAPLAACTLVYADELPNAVVLGNSLRQFHPEARFTVLVIDGTPGQLAIPGAAILTLGDLGLEPGEERRLPMLLERAELRAHAQAALLEMLARKSADPIACFSPATQLFGPLTDVFETLRTAAAVIATERIENEWGDEGRSFIGIPPGGEVLVRAPESFTTISEPAFAINYSNLVPITLTRAGAGYTSDGRPLRSFDFRGYDPAKPHLLSRYQGLEPRILLSEFPVVAELCDGYRELLVQAGYSADRSAPRRFEILPSGLRLDPRMVRIYGEAISKFRSGAAPEPPSPFGAEGEAGFVRWLNEPIDLTGKHVTRYMLAVHEDRPDVKTAFPDPLNRDANSFRDWYLNFGAKELDLPAVFVPAKKEVTVAAPTEVPLNVAGYFRAELGIGTAARSIIAALEAANIPVNTVAFDRTASRLSHPYTERTVESPGADTNIVCINPDQIGAFAEQVGPAFFHGRYTIGVWFWEVEDFPAAFHHAFNYVDEIWVASEFMRQTFLKVSPKPVFKYRLPVLPTSIDKSITRSRLGLPESFVFLFSFDFFSVLERKNPLGLIQAFTTAFAPAEGPTLVIKTINGDKRTSELEKLKYVIRGRPDVLLLDGYLAADENAALTALADCYVSLHRSEGFGLTMAEAMAFANPVIATAYSGNLEFMTAENSYLCPSRPCEVGPEREPYPPDSHWSDPDLAAAAALLRQVYEHPKEATARGRQGADDIQRQHSPAVAGNIIRDRILTIRRRRSDPGPVRSTAFLQDRIDELERLRGGESPSQ